MFLNRTEIRNQMESLQFDPLDERKANYAYEDLKIKCIIHNGKTIRENPTNIIVLNNSSEIKLPPQGMACIITNKVEIHSNQIGFLYQKQSNYSRGLWILETDMIHPGYTGHLRMHIVNMSTAHEKIHLNDDALELYVYECKDKSFGSSDDPIMEFEPFIMKVSKEEAKYPDVFMNFDGHAREISKINFPLTIKLFAAVATLAMIIPTLIGGALAWQAHNNLNSLVDIDKAIRLEKIDAMSKIQDIEARLKAVEPQNNTSNSSGT